MIRGKERRTKRDFTPSKQIEYFNNVAPPKTDLSGFPSLLNAKCIHAPQLRTAQIATNAVATDLVPRPSPTGRSSVFTAHQTRLWNCESRDPSNSRPNRQSGGDPEVAARNRKRGGRAAIHPDVIRGAPMRARCGWLKGGCCRPTPPSGSADSPPALHLPRSGPTSVDLSLGGRGRNPEI